MYLSIGFSFPLTISSFPFISSLCFYHTHEHTHLRSFFNDLHSLYHTSLPMIVTGCTSQSAIESWYANATWFILTDLWGYRQTDAHLWEENEQCRGSIPHPIIPQVTYQDRNWFEWLIYDYSCKQFETHASP